MAGTNAGKKPTVSAISLFDFDGTRRTNQAKRSCESLLCDVWLAVLGRSQTNRENNVEMAPLCQFGWWFMTLLWSCEAVKLVDSQVLLLAVY